LLQNVMSVPPSLIGTTIGAYEIQALLGSGGMATVYCGFDVNLHRAVAVKVLSTTLAADSSYVDLFRQEARLVASLRHPHIAQVYAFGEHTGAPYMIQELLPGPTLEQRIKDLADRHEHMPQQVVIATVTQLASALDAAHAIGVIHSIFTARLPVSGQPRLYLRPGSHLLQAQWLLLHPLPRRLPYHHLDSHASSYRSWDFS
jgi:hypothetical protein